jgi:hypothetical protein
MKTLICVNTLTEIDSSVYAGHCNFWFRLGRKTTDEFFFYTPHRTSIDRARNTAAQMALEQECDFLMFIDDDVILHVDTYQRLKDAAADIAMAHTVIRGYPFDNMAFKGEWEVTKAGSERIKTLTFFNDWKDFLDTDGRYEADAVGCSCVLIKCELLKKLHKPYFVTSSSAGMTEDVYFCLKAKETLGKSNVRIIVDSTIATGHLMDKQIVTEANRDLLKQFAEAEHEVVYGAPMSKKEEEQDRGQMYLDLVEKVW